MWGRDLHESAAATFCLPLLPGFRAPRHGDGLGSRPGGGIGDQGDELAHGDVDQRPSDSHREGARSQQLRDDPG